MCKYIYVYMYIYRERPDITLPPLLQLLRNCHVYTKRPMSMKRGVSV